MELTRLKAVVIYPGVPSPVDQKGVRAGQQNAAGVLVFAGQAVGSPLLIAQRLRPGKENLKRPTRD